MSHALQQDSFIHQHHGHYFKVLPKTLIHNVNLKSIPQLFSQSNRQGLFRKFHAKLQKCAL